VFTKALEKKKKAATKENLAKTNYPPKQARKPPFNVRAHQHRGGMGWPCQGCTGGTGRPCQGWHGCASWHGLAVPTIQKWHGRAHPAVVARVARATFLSSWSVFFTWHSLPLLFGTTCFTWHSLLVWPSSRIDFGLLFKLIFKLPTKH